MTRRIEGAVFRSEADVVGAARACRGRGIEIVDVLSPHPLHGIDDIVGIRRTRLATITLAAGAAGFALGTWLQVWTSAVDWPLDVGGKPWNSMPAFLPVTFEITVLFAGLATVAALLIRCRLLPGRRAKWTGLGVTDDRYALLVAPPPGSQAQDQRDAFWGALGAERSFVAEEPR